MPHQAFQPRLSIRDRLAVLAQDKILGGMVEDERRQPAGVHLGPRPTPDVDPSIPQQKRLQVLALFAQILHRGFARSDEIADRFMIRIRHPDRRQLASAMQSRQGDCIRRFVLTCSPGLFGISEGAITVHSCPSSMICRYSRNRSVRLRNRTTACYTWRLTSQ